jgi:hypothetical protein
LGYRVMDPRLIVSAVSWQKQRSTRLSQFDSLD